MLLAAAAEAANQSSGNLWLLGAACALPTIAAAISIFSTIATKRDVEAVKETQNENKVDTDKRLIQLEADIKVVNAGSESRSVLLHSRIDEVLAATSEQKGILQSVCKQLDNISDALMKKGLGS